MYQKKVTSNPRRVCLIMSSMERSVPSCTRLMFTVAG
jgi:hypothetical protein